jgi:hypothetical protein
VLNRASFSIGSVASVCCIESRPEMSTVNTPAYTLILELNCADSYFAPQQLKLPVQFDVLQLQFAFIEAFIVLRVFRYFASPFIVFKSCSKMLTVNLY